MITDEELDKLVSDYIKKRNEIIEMYAKNRAEFLLSIQNADNHIFAKNNQIDSLYEINRHLMKGDK